MDSMKRILSALLLSLIALTATAQDQDQERPDRWYEVEVLVFEQRGASSTEELPEIPGKIDTAGAIELVSGAGGSQPAAYQTLPPENYRLRSAFNKLTNSSKYQPLFHTAWRQSIPPREKADSIHLSSKSVDGIITVGISRYLHVTTGLLAQKSGASEIDNKFHLQGTLRMRSGEVHYIDHPMGGMLIMFTPYNP